MIEDASNNNFVELLRANNFILQVHLRFLETAKFRILFRDKEHMLLKLAIRA